MKEYTAIYNTHSLKGVEYSYKAENQERAIAFAEMKFGQFPNIVIIENRSLLCKANEGRVVFFNGAVVK